MYHQKGIARITRRGKERRVARRLLVEGLTAAMISDGRRRTSFVVVDGIVDNGGHVQCTVLTNGQKQIRQSKVILVDNVALNGVHKPTQLIV